MGEKVLFLSTLSCTITVLHANDWLLLTAVSDIFVKDIKLKQLKEWHPVAPGEAVDYMAFVCV